MRFRVRGMGLGYIEVGVPGSGLEFRALGEAGQIPIPDRPGMCRDEGPDWGWFRA